MRQFAVLVLSLCLSSVVVAAESGGAKKPDLAKGEQIYTQQCLSCHGAEGNSTAVTYPKLAGQHADYLVKQLSNFKPAKEGEKPLRENAIMAGFAAGLSTEDMRNIAAYLESKSQKPSTAKNKELLELGQKIYRGGIAEKKVPACAGCHSPNGAGIPSQYPRIGGQHAQYTESQLVGFRAGSRGNSGQMMTISAKLSDKEIKAVSDYVAGLR